MKFLGWLVICLGIALACIGPVVVWIAWMNNWLILDLAALFVPHTGREVSKGYVLACSWIPGFVVVAAGMMLLDRGKGPKAAPADAVGAGTETTKSDSPSAQQT